MEWVSDLSARIALPFLAAAVILCGWHTSELRAEDNMPSKSAFQLPIGDSGLAPKTMGGRQFWGDVQFFRGWRIQQNVFTGHCRLLDEKDRRHARGSLEFCRQKLIEVKRKRGLEPMSGTAVILVHGIIRSSKSFRQMQGKLEEAGYLVVGFDYPSTRVDISRSAEYLHQVIDSLEGVEQIHLVVHSMGGLVVRAYLQDHRDQRIQRMVMMGVPNVGAQLADRLQDRLLYKAIYGPAGQQLGKDPRGLIAELPTPPFEFAIIAGGLGKETDGYNPLIVGDDDGTVAVDSTRLPGAADFLLVRCPHSFLMVHDEALDSTIRFLQTGSLRSIGKRAN